ncbi:MAG: hypothetical protein HY901_07285 [Deltaproteobacteria bacterium]|nr:hypothetical protein [Deltaproteobacteria bacterium]
MRDHRRILGSLFIGWAVVQAATSIVLAARGDLPAGSPGWNALWWGLVAAMAALYAWLGIRLRAHDPRVRVMSIAFSAFALLSFPVGTALGIYGLWVLLRRPREAAA